MAYVAYSSRTHIDKVQRAYTDLHTFGYWDACVYLDHVTSYSIYPGPGVSETLLREWRANSPKAFANHFHCQVRQRNAPGVAQDLVLTNCRHPLFLVELVGVCAPFFTGGSFA